MSDTKLKIIYNGPLTGTPSQDYRDRECKNEAVITKAFGWPSNVTQERIIMMTILGNQHSFKN